MMTRMISPNCVVVIGIQMPGHCVVIDHCITTDATGVCAYCAVCKKHKKARIDVFFFLNVIVVTSIIMIGSYNKYL